MRAIEDVREGQTVEGLLSISDVDRWGHVSVEVETDGGSFSVVVDIIEVLEPSPVVVATRRGKRVADLAQAEREGLLLPPIVRVGGTWDDLEAALIERAQPLLAAGWTITSSEREASWEYGDSVFLGLALDDQLIELEYYDHGQLVAYAVSPEGEEPDEDSEPYFSIYDSTSASALTEFLAQGWLS